MNPALSDVGPPPHVATVPVTADWLAVVATMGRARREAIGSFVTRIDEDRGAVRWEAFGVFEKQQQSQGSRFAAGSA